MPAGYAETDTTGTYTAGTADLGSASSGVADADNELSKNPGGVDESQTDYIAEISGNVELLTEQVTALVSVNLVLVVAIFLCFGALCVRTLVRSFEVR